MSVGAGAAQARELAYDALVLWLRATPRAALPQAHEAAAAFVRRVRTRLEVAGGELLPASGASTGASFDPIELPDLIELALGALHDAELEAADVEVACALALGPIEWTVDAKAPSGAAIDRAQHLAQRAESGELVLDDAAASQAEPTHLFARELRSPAASGRVIDAAFPSRAECRGALRQLQTARLPALAQASHERIRESVLARSDARVVIAAVHPHSALDRVARMHDELRPRVLLHASREGGGLVPLGALRTALQRAWPSLQSDLATWIPDAQLRATLRAVHDGARTRRSEAADALAALLDGLHEAALRPLIVLERARELDAPSLLVITDALARTRGCALLATMEEGKMPPSVLARAGELRVVALEALDEESRVEVATQVLGLDAPSELAHHVAAVGGDTLVGIDEAARVLVANGEIVHDGHGFRFRTGERTRPWPLPLDELVARRAAGLLPGAYRVLEAACIAPLAAARELVQAVAEQDGLRPETVESALQQLEAEGWLCAASTLAPIALATRAAIRGSMPPARSAELHRFVASALGVSAPEGPSFHHALVAHHLAEGGRDREAAAALLDAAGAATECGFERMAVRLAAVALKLDGSRNTRARASQVARTFESRPQRDTLDDTQPGRDERRAAHVTQPVMPPPTTPPDAGSADEVASHDAATIARDAVRGAVAAIATRDIDAAEGLLDTAVAAGYGRAAATRLSALAQLARGDVVEAVRTLKRVRPPGRSGKEPLTAALILLEAGAALDATRSALEALALCREARDAAGERAAVLVLAGCYRALGREHDAGRLEARALPT